MQNHMKSIMMIESAMIDAHGHESTRSIETVNKTGPYLRICAFYQLKLNLVSPQRIVFHSFNSNIVAPLVDCEQHCSKVDGFLTCEAPWTFSHPLTLHVM